jgi:hypothetical protein
MLLGNKPVDETGSVRNEFENSNGRKFNHTYSVRSRQIQCTILLIRRLVKGILDGEYTGDVVRFTKPVVGLVVGYRKVGQVPGLRSEEVSKLSIRPDMKIRRPKLKPAQ